MRNNTPESSSSIMGSPGEGLATPRQRANLVLKRLGTFDYSDLATADRDRIIAGIQRDVLTQNYANVSWILSDPAERVPELLSEIESTQRHLETHADDVERFLDNPDLDLSRTTHRALEVIGGVAPNDETDSLLQQTISVTLALRASKAGSTLVWMMRRGDFDESPDLKNRIQGLLVFPSGQGNQDNSG